VSVPQRVRVVGAGLLGTSIALALRVRGVDVTLTDTSPVSAALAADMGGGRLASDDDAAPDVVVVAAPPDVTADVITAELERWPEATVTDVASVKNAVVVAVRELAGADAAARYVPGHPMAGRERSGAVAARSDLFEGRTWVVCPDGAEAERVRDVISLAESVGARVVTMAPEEHDTAVAAVSHVPQLAASLVAAQLRELSEPAVGLSGQGVRDVTRIAASDPLLWTQILAGNARAVRPVVDRFIEELTAVRDALRAVEQPDSPAAGDGLGPGPRAVLAGTIAAGQDGQARIPGKHGTPPTTYATVAVVVPDEPGALGRLFVVVGESGVSVEDLRLEHDASVAAGLLEIDVLPARAEVLREVLAAKGWSVHVLETH
jgi:prephenate dehydrogenase